MDETRSALAEKLGALTEKISGTVETVQETVQDAVSTVGQTVETVENAVSAVAETVESTVETVGETAQAAVENVKEAFNFPKQFENHPWLFLGGSVVVGFVGGKILLNMLPDEDANTSGPAAWTANHMAEYMERSSASTAEPASFAGADWGDGRGGSHGREAGAETGEQSSWFGSLLQRFMPDLNKVKELALGTFFATARDLVSQSLPQSLKNDVQTLFNDMAEHAGGKPIKGSVFEEKDEESRNDAGNQRQEKEQEVAI
jgi:ElaB/YqjD/DUF883 family membrane-anchored ribosome-binding protein